MGASSVPKRQAKPATSPTVLLCTGACTLGLAVSAQLLVASNNVSYLDAHSTYQDIAIYGLAAAGFILVPVLDAVHGIDLKLRIGGIMCFAYCAVITLTAHFDMAKGHPNPEWLVASLDYVVEDRASSDAIVQVLWVLFAFVLLEVLAHFAGHGVKLCSEGHAKLKKQKGAK
jgi:hypothetical protein